MELQTIANIVILIGGACVAIKNILEFFGKPFSFVKKKTNEELE
jgi:hypothetical protein